VSYGHAHHLNAKSGQAEPGASPADDLVSPVDPALYRRDDVRPVLAERDIAALYRVLKDVGVTQRQIAELTGQSQSEVSEILAGRKVLSYDLLVRIAEGFHVPRELMGLSYGEPGAYGGQGTVADPPQGVDTEMLRRRLIELGAGLALGAPAAKLAPLLKRLELPDPSPVPLPSQLGAVHVAKVRDLTRRLGDARRVYGPDPEVSGAAAAWGRRLLDVPGTDAVRKALMVAVAELHIEAGWEAFDAGLYDRAICHYGRALQLATETGDAYCQAVALNRAGLATVEYGDPNEGLKLLQVGTVTALGIPADEPRPVVVGGSGRAAVQAIALADSATALSCLDYPEAARAADTALAKSRELWQPHPDQPNGDLDRPAACLELDRDRLDTAQPFAAASVRRWEGVSQVGHTHSGVLLATIHVRAGEPDGLRMAHSAVTAAARLTSVRVCRRLEPLAAALEARPGSDYRELARMARQVAATRA